MNKVWGLSLIISLISFLTNAKEDYSALTDHIIKSHHCGMIAAGYETKFDKIDKTTDNVEIVRLITIVCNVAQFIEKEPLTDLELQTPSGRIYAAVRKNKDNKYHTIDEGTRCVTQKNGSCECITVVKKEYFDQLKNKKRNSI